MSFTKGMALTSWRWMVGALSPRPPLFPRFWIILTASAALYATTYGEWILTRLSYHPSIYSFCFLVLLFVAILPARLFILSLPLAIGILKAMSVVNEAKISVLFLPVTSFDARVVIRDPSILVNALGLWNLVYEVGAITAACVLVACGLYFKRRRTRNRVEAVPARMPFPRVTSVGVNGTCVLIVLASAWLSMARYGEFIYTNLASQDKTLWLGLWKPASQVSLSRRLGVAEYIAFSVFAANESTTSIFAADGPGVPTDETTTVARRFVNIPVDSSRKLLPNIVIFHAESSFDPNAAFNLSAPVNLTLWSPLSETTALGPLHVNVIGGGSWVTEFEVLTGVDSRTFGFQGFYTNYYIAPMVKNTFVSYLARRGYRTRAFYTAERDFYNVEMAYKAYGFTDFVDEKALGLSDNWTEQVDRNIIASAIQNGAFQEDGPFLYFLGTTENHGPHPCKHFSNAQLFVTTFRDAASFEQNCQLNEYVRRAGSTSDAVERVLGELKRIEQQTGRPFVLLIYGDHQPWSFTRAFFITL